MSDTVTHRVYLRWPAQKTSDQTTTTSGAVAQLAYDELRARQDLAGQDVTVVWNMTPAGQSKPSSGRHYNFATGEESRR